MRVRGVYLLCFGPQVIYHYRTTKVQEFVTHRAWLCLSSVHHSFFFFKIHVTVDSCWVIAAPWCVCMLAATLFSLAYCVQHGISTYHCWDCNKTHQNCYLHAYFTLRLTLRLRLTRAPLRGYCAVLQTLLKTFFFFLGFNITYQPSNWTIFTYIVCTMMCLCQVSSDVKIKNWLSQTNRTALDKKPSFKGFIYETL